MRLGKKCSYKERIFGKFKESMGEGMSEEKLIKLEQELLFEWDCT